MLLKIGKYANQEVTTLQEASILTRDVIINNDLGARNYPGAKVYEGKKIVAKIAYNGRIILPGDEYF